MEANCEIERDLAASRAQNDIGSARRSLFTEKLILLSLTGTIARQEERPAIAATDCDKEGDKHEEDTEEEFCHG